MSYRVVLQRLAVVDLDEAYTWVAQNAPETAARWLDRFHDALKTLDTNPQRCPLAREDRQVALELREFHYGRKRNVFRVLFTIDGEIVRVLRIRRAQRRPASRGEIEDALLPDEDQ